MYIILKLKNGFIHLLNLGYDIQSWTILEKKNVCRSKQFKEKVSLFEMLALLKKKNTLHFMSCNAMHSSVTLHICKILSHFFLFSMFMNIPLKIEKKDLTWHYFKMGDKLIFFLKSYKFFFFGYPFYLLLFIKFLKNWSYNKT